MYKDGQAHLVFNGFNKYGKYQMPVVVEYKTKHSTGEWWYYVRFANGHTTYLTLEQVEYFSRMTIKTRKIQTF